MKSFKKVILAAALFLVVSTTAQAGTLLSDLNNNVQTNGNVLSDARLVDDDDSIWTEILITAGNVLSDLLSKGR